MASSGQMRHVVTIHAPEGTYGTGNPSPAVDIAEHVPAKIDALPLPFQQQERLAAGGLNTQVVYAIEMRYRDDVQANFVLNEECCMQRTFQIIQMIPSDRLDWLQLTCVVAG